MKLMNLADNIVKYRRKNNLSQEQLATALNISRQSISKWETGENLPSIDNLISLSGLLDISLDELITGEPYLHFPFNYGKPQSKAAAIILGFFVLLGLTVGFLGRFWYGLIAALLMYMAIVNFYPFDYKRYYNYWTLEKTGIRYVPNSQKVYGFIGNMYLPLLAFFRMRKTEFVTYKEIKKIEIKVDLFEYQPSKSLSLGPNSGNAAQMIVEPFYFQITTVDDKMIYLNLKDFYWHKTLERQMLPTIILFLKRKNLEFIDQQGITQLVMDRDIKLVNRLYELRDEKNLQVPKQS